MDVAANCEASSTFYKVEEEGETMSWRRNGRLRVEFFNVSVSGSRKEGAVPVLEGKRSMRDDSWFGRGGVTG
jgi:hypothetical protein